MKPGVNRQNEVKPGRKMEPGVNCQDQVEPGEK